MPDPLSHEWREEEEELRRMVVYAQAAKDHPTWSVAYARDVPWLLAKLVQMEVLKETLVHIALEPGQEGRVYTGWAMAALVEAYPAEFTPDRPPESEK